MTAVNEALEQAVFRPATVALIGLSSNPGSPAGRPLHYMRQNGFQGMVQVVNPARPEVQGLPTVASVHDCDPVPDHAYILVGQARVEQAVADCAAAGVRVATILADGYAESGAEGAARQQRLVAIANDAGMRLLGPNSMGVADLHLGTMITTNAIYQEPGHLGGAVGLISQSGSMMGGLISRARAVGIGYSRIAAVGNECDLGVAELGAMMVADPRTEVITLFLETIRNADGLARFAAMAHRAGKPVIAYKLGRSELGQQMAVAHTGALLAEDSVTDAFLREIGIARVTTLEGLVEAPMLFRGRSPHETPPRVGVLTTTGGGGATVTDRLALEGVALAPPSDATLDAVRATGLDVGHGPMVDLTMAGAAPDFVRPTVEAVARDPDVGIVLSITGSSGRSSPETTVAGLAGAETGGKPLACFVVPDAVPTVAALIDAGLPAFRTPEACADALGAFCRWRTPRIESLARTPAAAQGHALDEGNSLELLKECGIDIVETAVLKAGDTGPLPFGWPVVAKVLSDQVPHKTDAGGVVVGISGPAELADAMARIKASVEAHHPGLTVDRFLISPMIHPIQEVLVGYRLDPSVGPVVTLAPGGITVGLYDDKAVRLAPVDLATAHEMIAEVKGLAPLRGYRGQKAGDLDALARTIAAMSSLATHESMVLEAEANPVMVTPDRAVAVDALITVPADTTDTP